MVQVVSLAALVAMFAVGVTTSINIGVLAFGAAFVIGNRSTDLTTGDIVGLFPKEIVIILLGIMVLFGVARCNGTVDLLVSWALRLMRGKRWALVWLMFVLGAALMTVGAVLALALLAPIAMPIAERYRIDPLLMGMMTCHGVVGAAFSPITVYGAFANSWMTSTGLPTDPVLLYVIPLSLNFVMALALFLVRGRDLLCDPPDYPSPEDPACSDRARQPGTPGRVEAADGSPAAADTITLNRRLTPLRMITLIGLLALLVSALLSADVGASSLVIASVLLLVAPRVHAAALDSVHWSVVLVVSGVLTFMGVLRANGTIDYLGALASSLGAPILTMLVLCAVAALMSSVASSMATLGIVLPLAGSVVQSHPQTAVALVAAMCFAALVADISPFTTNGAMVIGCAKVANLQAFRRSIFAYSGYVVLTAPLLAWSAVVIPVTT
ncbi:SLC13 family permease [Mycobacterium sp. NPDC003449]